MKYVLFFACLLIAGSFSILRAQGPPFSLKRADRRTAMMMAAPDPATKDHPILAGQTVWAMNMT